MSNYLPQVSLPSVPFRYSFSGADVKTFAYFPSSLAPFEKGGAAPTDSVCALESLHTLSISVHEPKSPVRALGFKNVKGFARSIRTIAGSMIFTVVEGHPLEKLAQKDPNSRSSWSIDKDITGMGTIIQQSKSSDIRTDLRLPTLFSPFNLVSLYTSELPQWQVDFTKNTVLTGATGLAVSSYTPYTPSISNAALMLIGVEFVDEGIVTSVNDMVTEVVYQFVARDIRTLSRFHFVMPPTTDAPYAYKQFATQLTNFLVQVDMIIRRENQRAFAFNAGQPNVENLRLGETSTVITEEQDALSAWRDHEAWPDRF